MKTILRKAGTGAAGIGLYLVGLLFNLVSIVLPLLVTGGLLVAAWRFITD